MNAPLALPSTNRAPRLPDLRRTLRLHPGPRSRDGAPSWTLEDAARGRFYRIGWAEAEILARWQMGSAQAIAEAINRETTLALSREDVDAFSQFLRSMQLVEVSGDAALADLRKRGEAGKSSGWSAWLLSNYLSIRIPLLRPDRFLSRSYRHVAPLFSRSFALATLTAAVLGLYLAARQWDSFLHTFLHFFSLEGALLAAVTLSLTKVLHEFGHAYTCKRYGCRVPTMGVAFLVLWPVLYTDASGAWRLTSRRQRMAIGAAGMGVELCLAAWATLAWSFLPDGMLRSAAFMLASTTWILTLAVNLNPLMRFDGYFLFSDLLDVPNLQERAFALARWRMRETLFGFGDAPPEHFAPALRRVLLGYAFATWVYRFFLFLGIALLVYHFAFKLLGVLLFIVEIVHFILRPIIGELRHWHQRRKDYRMNRNTLICASVLLVALFLLAWPWRSRIEAPALLRAERQAILLTPAGARLERIEVQPGEPVRAGQTLFRLHSAQLQHDLQGLEREIEQLRQQSSLQVRASEGSARQSIAREELQVALERRLALQERMAQLQVKAPFDGVLVDSAAPLAAGEWLPAGEWLGTVANAGSERVEAFVGEADRERLQVGAQAWFLPEDPGRPRRLLQVEDIGQTAVRQLTSAPELASVYQGALAAQLDEQRVPVPEQALYRVQLRPLDNHSEAMPITLRGNASISGDARSPLMQAWRRVLTILIRESAF
ncbi:MULTISPECIES: HlyD family efflux transporter periplasmic adaptor subunit [Pseudomonas]|uniref:Hemolysin D n=2 Tax=Pseudomonadaceae TaxID=135621 RepID=A0A0D0L5J8_9PSED|nr:MULTISPECIES: HlyD family efflux transporter periplasmic adaptor subunit [Pseudomonas]KIQ06325.1 hemolysin D [Pseudomonas fulva]MCW2291471.1 putative peptide zinc metalloprotease protein [Pseudomonas sp. BIGb0408]NYH73958.1 putative peptide zinc metalloprotease protein [Pseudomonas flavescens]